MEKKKEEDDEVQFGPQGNITVKNCFFLNFLSRKFICRYPPVILSKFLNFNLVAFFLLIPNMVSILMVEHRKWSKIRTGKIRT